MNSNYEVGFIGRVRIRLGSQVFKVLMYY
jgi:hypothetical protein